MGICGIICLIACTSALFVPIVSNCALAVYTVAITSLLYIIYAFICVIRFYINSYNYKQELHNEEVELLQYIFGEFHKHPLYSTVDIKFTRKNKKVINEVLRDFIEEHKDYNTDYYNKLIYSCKCAITCLDDLR
jgi:hypothetical protein